MCGEFKSNNNFSLSCEDVKGTVLTKQKLHVYQINDELPLSKIRLSNLESVLTTKLIFWK